MSKLLFSQLVEIVGRKNLITDAAEVSNYTKGIRGEEGNAEFVVRPATTNEVSLTIAAVVSAGYDPVIQSANTGLVGGSVPDSCSGQCVVQLSRLREKLQIDYINRAVRVSAGFHLSELNEQLSEAGFEFPIDLGADPLIGGMIATNTGGARYLRYGDVRRNTLGITVVLFDEAGTVLDLSKPLRKDNSAIDLKQNFIGSNGLLGVVTEATLEIHCSPTLRATALITPSNTERVFEILNLFEREAGSFLSAFELMSKGAVDAALLHTPTLRNPFSSSDVPADVILVELSHCAVDALEVDFLDKLLLGVLEGMWEQTNAPILDAIVAPPEELWRLRHTLSEGVRNAGQLIPFDLSFERSKLFKFREAATTWLKKSKPDLLICDFGHVADGGVHFNLVQPTPDVRQLSTEEVTDLRDWIIDLAVSEFGGSFSAEHGLGTSNERYYEAHTDECVKQMSKEISAIFDRRQGRPRASILSAHQNHSDKSNPLVRAAQ